MANLLDYVATVQDQSFETLPPTAVDGMIFAELAYFDWAQVAASGTLATLTEPTLQTTMTENEWRPEASLALLQALVIAPRYQHLRWHDFVNQLNLAVEKQFSAITFSLGDQHFLAFRGTSAAFVDWKEDFNLAYMKTIPSQHAALTYLRHIARLFPGQYWLCGHSKGGTLATYAGVHAPQSLQTSIRHVVNGDGPGLGAPLPTDFQPRVTKLVPQTSLVGTLFDPTQAYTVVQSDAHGIDQHDPFSWAVSGLDFVHLPETDFMSQYMQKSIATWVASLDEATKRACLNAAYDLLRQSQVQTFKELQADWLESGKRLLTALKNIDPQTREDWGRALSLLVTALRESLPDAAFNLPQDWHWPNWSWPTAATALPKEGQTDDSSDSQ